MTPEETLEAWLAVLAARPGAVAVIGQEGLQDWDRTVVDAFKAKGLLKKAHPGASIPCPGCEEQCVRPVHVLPGASMAFIVCDLRSDTNRVPIPLASLDRWQTSGDALAALLTAMLGIHQPVARRDAPGRWEIGNLKGKKHASHVVLMAEDEFLLSLAGHTVRLTEVLGFEKGSFWMDQKKLTHCVDNPASGGGDRESAQERRQRLRREHNEEIAKGNRAPTKTLALREGRTERRIRALLEDENKSVV